MSSGSLVRNRTRWPGVREIVFSVMRDQQGPIDEMDIRLYARETVSKSVQQWPFMFIIVVRMGPWKFHFALKEDYYDNMTSRNFPMVFNLRADPFESYDSIDSYGHLAQKVSWLVQPMAAKMMEHLKTLAEYPPVQGGTSFDMSNVVEEFLEKGQQ